MAFLGFMKGKKQQPAATNQKTKEMPLPPSMGEDLNMPGFSDESHTDDLKLPEIPEIDTNQGPTMPDMPQQPVDDMSSFADMPGVPQIETPEPQQPEEPLPEPPRAPEEIPAPPPEPPRAPEEIPAPPPEPPRAPEEIPAPPPEPPRAPEKKPEEPYDHTPIAKHPSEPGMPVAGPQEFYIKGEDYRELLSGLDMAMAKQKEKIMQAESDIFAVEEKEYSRFILTIEDLHRRLMLAETILFEERREK